MKKILVLLLLISSVSAQTYIYEGENLEVVDGIAVFPEDTVMIFYSWGTIRIPNLNLLGKCEITALAKEDYAGDEHVKLVIETPGFIDSVYVDSQDWKEYIFTGNVEYPGDWEFSFVNDYSGRRLYIDWIRIRKVDFKGEVILTWDENPEPDLAGYVVYTGKESRIYSYRKNVGNVTTDTTRGLPDGKYYFAVSAYDTANNGSGFSNEVSAIVNKDSNDYLIYWASLDTVSGYIVRWMSDVTNEIQTVDVGLDTLYLIEDATNSYRHFWWKVTHYDSAGIESGGMEHHFYEQRSDKDFNDMVDVIDLQYFYETSGAMIGNNNFDFFFDMIEPIGFVDVRDLQIFYEDSGVMYNNIGGNK